MRTLALCLLLSTTAASAADNPLVGHHKHVYSGAKKILLRAAETMPEEHYSFKPTETVRSYGQLVAHVADAQYTFCSAVLGEKNPGLKIEKSKTSKSDLIAALNDAFVYCERAYAAIDDASGAETVNFSGSDTPKLGVLTVNAVHTIEHYGNMVTYLRMKDLVPPTSDREFMKQLAK